jgi:hypothetical protein
MSIFQIHSFAGYEIVDALPRNITGGLLESKSIVRNGVLPTKLSIHEK